MSKYFIFLVILAAGYAKSHAKGDAQGSVKSDGKEEGRFAAPLNEQDNARTFNAPWKHFLNNQYQNRYLPQHGYSGFLPGIFSHGGGFLSNLHNKFQKPFLRPHPVAQPVHPVQPIHPVHPIPMKPTYPVYPVPVVPFYPEPVFTKPFVPSVPIHAPILPQPVFPVEPSLPAYHKPTFVVSQKIIHKPVVAEKVEVVRRPVLSELVHTIHRPLIHEELQVVKIPTYVQHVVEKPLVTKPISDEHVGSPIYLPAQQFTIHEKPLPLRPVTTGVYQIPHQTFAGHGSGYESNKPGYTFGSSYGGIGAGYGLGSGYGGGVGTSYGVPSYSIGSSYGGLGSSYAGPSSSYGGLGSSYGGLGSSYGGVGSSYGGLSSSYGGVGSSYGGLSSSYGGLGYGYGPGPSYGMSRLNFGNKYGGVGSSYGIPSYNFGPGYGGMGSSYGTPVYNFGSGYGGMYNYGSGGYGGESEGVGPTFLEPAPSCKQNSNCKPTRNEELIYDKEQQPPYSPQMWYDSPQLTPQQAKSMIEDYGFEGDYPYFAPMSDPSTDEQVTKVREFLDDPTTRMELMYMLQNYVEKNVTPPTQMLDGDKPTGKSSNEDTSTAEGADEAAEERAVKKVLEQVKHFKPSSLKKLEEGTKDLQVDVAKKMGSKMDDVVSTKSTESTSTVSTVAQN